MKVLTALFLALILTGAAVADEVYVPDSNPSTGGSNAIPFWAEWSAINGSIRYQALYSAAQLGNKAFVIKEISFAANYTGSFSATQFQVRISHVTATTLNPMMDLNIPSPVTCYDGTISFPTTVGTWAPLGLTGSFSYNGTDNLVVDVRYFGGKTTLTGSGSQGRFRSAAINRSWAYQNYNATQQSGSDSLAGLKTRFTVDFITISASGKPNPGGTVTLDLSAPADGGLPYQIGSSLGTGPIPIDTRQLGLSLDALLDVTVNGYLPMIFKNYAGILDAAGKGKGTIDIPNLPALVGVKFHSAFVTIDTTAPSNIKSISPTETIAITT